MSGFALRVRPAAGAATQDGAADLLRSIADRGPDRKAAVTIGHVEVAHAAFHVTPEADDEHFPARHPSRDMWVVADARLDYRNELMEDLRAAGCSFEPYTDADLILAAHEVWGENAQRHLTGDFAYVVCDSGTVIAARDVLGGKPLFWSSLGSDVLIASSLRCILDELPAIPPPDEEFVVEILCDSLSSDERTAYIGIRRLAPGSRLRCPASLDLAVEQVDQLKIGPVLDVDVEKAAVLVRETLERAVRERIRGRDDVATELSGGLDSSTIVGLVAAATPKRRPVTLSEVYPGEDCDESVFINAVIEQTNATSLLLDATSVDPIDLHSESAAAGDIVGYPEPSAELWSIAAAAGCRVLLTGQGGDEVFFHTNLYACDIFDDEGIAAFLRHCRSLGSRRKAQSRIRTIASRNLLAAFPHVPLVIESWKRRRRVRSMKWLTPEISSKLGRRNQTERARDTPSAWNRGARHELLTNPMSTAAYEFMDRTSAGIVDLRHPFRDRRFVELILRLPGQSIHPGGTERHLHRHAFSDVMPPLVRDRTDKAEFSSTYLRSMTRNAPDGFANLATHKRGWTLADPICSWYDEFVSTGETEHVYPMWRSLCVSSWLDAVIDPATGGPNPDS